MSRYCIFDGKTKRARYTRASSLVTGAALPLRCCLSQPLSICTISMKRTPQMGAKKATLISKMSVLIYAKLTEKPLRAGRDQK